MDYRLSSLLLLLSLAVAVHCRDAERPPEDQEPGDAAEPQRRHGSGHSEIESQGDFGESGAGEPTETSVPDPVTVTLPPPIEIQPVVSKEHSLTDKMRWVTYSRNHKIIVQNATTYDAENVVNRHGLRQSEKQSQQCSSGNELKSPVGILYEFDDDESDNMDFGGNLPPTFKPVDTSQYPGFATGLLKSKNCTAFLIGKVSALTLAECVYDKNTGKWTKDLDLWRGRNCNTYISQMKWETVTVPHLYFESDESDYNWAYIKYQESSPSANWIGLSYDCQLKDKQSVHVTLNGYQQIDEATDNDTIAVGCPYQCPCLLLASMQRTFCPFDTVLSFPGSPLVAAPANSRHHNYIGTSPHLFGISSGTVQSSVNKVTLITKEMFWLVYDLMTHNEDEPKCRAGHQEWFINRLLKTG